MNKSNAKKYKWIYIVLLLSLVTGFAVFRLTNPPVGFKHFEPSYLPLNVSIMAKRINITRGHVRVEQNFRTEDWVYQITEEKHDGLRSIGTADQNYDVKSVIPTCNINTSRANAQYRVCHWIDYGRISVHEVKFIKDGTYITSLIPTNTEQEINRDEIDRYVDSFMKKSTIGLPVLESNGP